MNIIHSFYIIIFLFTFYSLINFSLITITHTLILIFNYTASVLVAFNIAVWYYQRQLIPACFLSTYIHIYDAQNKSIFVWFLPDT